MDQKIIKFGDWVLNDYKDSKNAKPLHVYCLQDWVPIEKILMKLNIYKYFDINYDIKYFDETIEMLNCWRNIIEFGKKKSKSSKKDLSVNLYTMKNI